jgi:hypothetical protein
MGNYTDYLKTVTMENDGWVLGHNENPDVDLPEDEEFVLLSPSGKLFSGDRETMERLLLDENKAGFRARYSK